MNKKGFSLIELLAVIIIIGIVGTIGIVSISGYIFQSRDATVVDTAKVYAEVVRTMRAKDIFYYEPKNGEVVIIPYSKVTGAEIENDHENGYGELLDDYCYIGVANNNNNYSYYITQADESYHFLDGVEYSTIDEGDILTGADVLASHGVKEFKTPFSGKSFVYDGANYNVKALRAEFEATISTTQENNKKVSVFDKIVNGDSVFTGTIILYQEGGANKIELRVTKSSSDSITSKRYVFDTKEHGDPTGYIGKWKGSTFDNNLKINIKDIDDSIVTFDIEIGGKIIYQDVVTTNKTTLYGQFYSDTKYSSSSVVVKGQLEDYDYFKSSGKFRSTYTNVVKYDGINYELKNPSVMYVIAKKN